jgi:hypothetical protein
MGPPPSNLTYGQGYEHGSTYGSAGSELVLGKNPGNVEWVSQNPGTVTVNRSWGWSPMYNAGFVRGFLDAGGTAIRFTSQEYTGVFGLEAQQALGGPP